jgi:hypothetical protein
MIKRNVAEPIEGIRRCGHYIARTGREENETDDPVVPPDKLYVPVASAEVKTEESKSILPRQTCQPQNPLDRD